MSVAGIPDSTSARIRIVGETVYGAAGWRVQLARGIALSRSSLYRYLRGKRPPNPAEIDGQLVRLMIAERRASERRARRIRRLERKFARYLDHVRIAREARRS
ncbi:MAG: hypothetical protein JWO56_1992 [Acidobacteria bacterium]|nr:hypothetical protein [Acidobacteriota bacterium]